MMRVRMSTVSNDPAFLEFLTDRLAEEVPAAEEYAAGYGVLVSYTVKWPGKAATTKRRALRLVDEGGAWVIDQHEDVQEGDMGDGSPVRAALSGG